MLNASSKFAICGLPLRVDSYKTCAFGCEYCFANNRKIMEFGKSLQIGNITSVRKRLERIFHGSGAKDGNLIDNLIASGITWHCGGMSDPFQPCEQEYGISAQLMELTKEYGISVLFSTKSDTIYDGKPDRELHTFQMSVTCLEPNSLEPHVPPPESRYEFYRSLKDAGYRVGIRMQPFIPFVTDERIVELYCDADHFTIEGLKLVPQNREHVQRVLEMTGIPKGAFTQMGLLNLRPEIRYELYKPIVRELEYYAIPYSIADNDMHHLSRSKCCCGDALIAKSSGFDNTAMCYEHGREYTLDDVRQCLGCIGECKANQLFTSNRQDGCVTVKDFYEKRFDRKSSPFSPKFLCEFNHIPTDEWEE